MGACLPPDLSCIIGLTFCICPGPPQILSAALHATHVTMQHWSNYTSHQHPYTITTLKHWLLHCGTIHIDLQSYLTSRSEHPPQTQSNIPMIKFTNNGSNCIKYTVRQPYWDRIVELNCVFSILGTSGYYERDNYMYWVSQSMNRIQNLQSAHNLIGWPSCNQMMKDVCVPNDKVWRV